MFYFSTRSLERMSDVDIRLVEIATRALETTQIDFGIPEFGGYRTENEQYELFKKGASKADGRRVFSRHQSGQALDVYAYVDGKASWNPDYLTHIAAHFLQAACEKGERIRWGGTWRGFTDMPHFELID